MLGTLLGMVLIVPVLMAVVFAPALVFFHGMDPVAAMKASFGACADNWLAFLVYGVILLVLSFFAALPIGLGFLLLVPVTTGALLSLIHIYRLRPALGTIPCSAARYENLEASTAGARIADARLVVATRLDQ